MQTFEIGPIKIRVDKIPSQPLDPPLPNTSKKPDVSKETPVTPVAIPTTKKEEFLQENTAPKSLDALEHRGIRVKESRGERFSRRTRRWWRDRGGPTGVTEEFIQSLAGIEKMLTNKKLRDEFTRKIKPILETRAHVAGYAAMTLNILLAAVTAGFIVQRGRRLASSVTRLAGSPAIVINPDGTRIPDDFGFGNIGNRSPQEKQLIDTISRMISGMTSITGIVQGGAILRLGPLHSLARANARIEGAIGSQVARIANRIAEGWDSRRHYGNVGSPQ